MKYQELETKIKEMQAEVERLKKEEKANQLPENFRYEHAKKVLNGDTNALTVMGRWRSTPQGLFHWSNIQQGHTELTDQDIIQIQKWCILYLENKTK